MNILHLEVNDAGGWRRVMSFANDATTLDNVQLRAAYLLMDLDATSPTRDEAETEEKR